MPTSLAIGMIACPRNDVDLVRILMNLRHGGFTEEVHIFAEPGTVYPRPSEGICWHENEHKLGGFRNWIGCMDWLWTHTGARYLMICEDDVDYARSSREKVNEILKAEPLSVLSLYLAKRYAKQVGDRQGWLNHHYGAHMFGTLAMIMPREFVRQFLDSQNVANAKQQKRQVSYDCLLYNWLAETQRARLCRAHRPSLADHVGPHSNLGHRDGPHRRGMDFRRDY